MEWKLQENEEQVYRSPILLVPVRLERPSISEGIRMARLDEDTVLNATLLELLRCQFGIGVAGVDPLPIDASGVDVPQIMDRFRDAIQGMPGWTVVEEALVGQFSFGKFVMWKDMTTRIDDFRKNKLVAHLIEGGGIYEDGIDVFPPEEVSRHIDCNALYCPLSADSSQLAAVLYSAMGKTFVLHGPPGTGKSQTITNIIAHNMALGRKVLFVSEKKAALDVVHRRLASIGLEPFCLELHSNKSGKSDVLAQFSEALKVGDLAEPADWSATVSQLESLRRELNGYVGALHAAYPNGMSAYDCLGVLLDRGLSRFDKCIGVDCTRQSLDGYNAIQGAISKLEAAAALVDMKAYHGLQILKDAVWSPSFEHDLQDCVASLQAATGRLETAFARIAALLALDPADTRFGILDRSQDLLHAMFASGDIPPELISEDVAASQDFLLRFRETCQRREATARKLESFKTGEVLEVDTKAVARRIRENNQCFLAIRFVKNIGLAKELSGIKKPGAGKLTIEELARVLPDFETLQATEADYRRDMPRAKELLGTLWKDGAPDWDALPTALANAWNCISAALETVADDHSRLQPVLGKLRTILGNARQELSPGTELAKAKDEFLDAWGLFRKWADAFGQYADFDLADYDLPAWKPVLDAVACNLGELRKVFRYRDARREAAGCGVGGFAVALEGGTLDAGALEGEFKYAYATKMLNAVFASEPKLANFSGIGHEERIRKFREIDGEYTRLSARMVFAKVAAGLPRRRSAAGLAQTTPLGILRHECEKKARHKPVRQLLSEIGPLAGMLKPCFLMSPLSVAQYLPPDTDQFDLVVFDEASQIPVWDAIGVIARAPQAIIVGDPKQMPPTNFFQKGDAGTDYDTEGVEDLESILDECLAAGVFPAYLGWHYRSRHESLISFSNHNYYGDKLLTFPSASESPRLGVHFRFVPDGIYDRKASRTNANEAKALVDYIFEAIGDPSWGDRSMGVVTFSEAQKALIEELVDKRREAEPGFERYFSDRNLEPFFVKNLENVQGDERDVILFSVCYAPDAEGKFAMNFGPLNKVGGERRLNVAVTRAKEEVVLFASIHAHQIDLDRTDSVGVAHLKEFIDFAEKGVVAENGTGMEPPEHDNFVDMVAAFLAENGYQVQRSVGQSACKINIAVRDPQAPDRYLAGIECDGDAYAHSTGARDREVLLPAVLQSLGWRICRVWSMDWMFDRQDAEKRLLTEIEAAKSAVSEPPPEPESPAPIDFREETATIASPEASCEKYRVWRPENYFKLADNFIHSDPKRHALLVESLRNFFTDKAFSEPKMRSSIVGKLRDLLETESPICESLLYKRISRAWKIKLTDNNRNLIALLLSRVGYNKTNPGLEYVYWAQGRSPETYGGFRVPDEEDPETKRTIGEIPPEEIANAMWSVATDVGGGDHETIFRETMKLFGLGVVTAKARIVLGHAMQILENRGVVNHQTREEGTAGVRQRTAEMEKDHASPHQESQWVLPPLDLLNPVPAGMEVAAPAPVVVLRQVLESEAWKTSTAKLPLALGQDVEGHAVVEELTHLPHLLVAGATGMGKSVCLNTLLMGLLMSRTPEELGLILVDKRAVEFTAYATLPHLMAPPITDAKTLVAALRWANLEMQRRSALFSKTGVRDIASYNAKFGREKARNAVVEERTGEDGIQFPTKLKYIVIVIDELAELMLEAKAEIEPAITNLAQLARATGIHMIISTQRPTVDIITGKIKANVPGRIAFKVVQKNDSRLILDREGAEKLVCNGEMLAVLGGGKVVHAQGAWSKDNEIKALVEWWSKQGEPCFNASLPMSMDRPSRFPGKDMEGGVGGMPMMPAPVGDNSTTEETFDADAREQELLEQALEIIRQTRRASTSSLQRRLRIGYNQASRLMEMLEQKGLVGPARGALPREILFDIGMGDGGEEGSATAKARIDPGHATHVSDGKGVVE